MKTCSNCGAQMNDNAIFCTKCGTKNEGMPSGEAQQADTQQSNTQQTNTQQSNTQQTAGGYNGSYQGAPVYVADPYDHTAEFTQKDISENKVIAMLVYLMGTVGIIIALLGAQNSPYVAFHVRQALKFVVIHILVGLATLFLFWTFIVPIAAGILGLVLFVVKIICFFSICSGKAKEPPILRSFGFLR